MKDNEKGEMSTLLAAIEDVERKRRRIGETAMDGGYRRDRQGRLS